MKDWEKEKKVQDTINKLNYLQWMFTSFINVERYHTKRNLSDLKDTAHDTFQQIYDALKLFEDEDLS